MPERELLQHLDVVFSVALHFCGNRAEAQDLAQETFARALAAKERFREGEGSSARAWLLSILSRLAANRRRDEGRHPAVELDDELAAPEPEALPRWRAVSPEALRTALLELPHRFREPVVLRDLLGLSYRDVAFVLDVPSGTAMSRLNRGRERLKALLLERFGSQVGEAAVDVKQVRQ
ncbi:MAG: RNA polymerase sigma factor [Archangiaceae bacterium]|nr:RNA polymerase sigma factor [Archangiaceae bacterium]